MRIAYGVNGYGRGHATRASAVVSELVRRHEILVLAGGDAYDAMWPDQPVVRIPTLGYQYRRSGTRSNFLTFKRNLPAILDLVFHGPALQMVENALRDFRPDVVISDAEPWTHQAARRLCIPRIGFDHFGIMAYCRPPMRWVDRIISLRDVGIYRALMGQPERVIVSSFFPAAAARQGVRVIPPLLRRELFQVRATRGEHLLAYFNKGMHLFSERIERVLQGVGLPVVIYGTSRHGVQGNLTFRPPSNLPFLEDLAGCRAVISTAGNQLVGEALHYGKPMLVMPEDSVEQRINALALERMGVGARETLHGLSIKAVQRFLAREASFLGNIRRFAHDGRREAVETIERMLDDLAGPHVARKLPIKVA